MGLNIIKAQQSDLETVKKITQTTIREVYPKYYPAGAVEFFSEHHSDEKIMRDINAGIVYLLITDDNTPAGTVTLTDNEIDRLHASLPAKSIYLKRGFREVDYLKIDTGRGDFLCADVMEKKA